MINVEEVKSVIKDVFPMSDVSVLDVDEELTKAIGLDSLGLMQLIVALEEKFELEVNDDYLMIEYLSTVNNIVSTLVKSK